ncbi:MAG: RNA-binding transcriptional accessory protein [Ruminococcaceae bacterium]|nr:RNA-binding transcriptional accessory protein [Oscillospiraceae bacterium]
MNIANIISSELGIKPAQAEAAIRLIDEGNTIPFIARYRKEVTGSLDDNILRTLSDRLTYLRNLEERKEEVIRLIDEQGKLTEELEQAIRAAQILREVEDLYRPYKQKKRTRATIAKEKGLEPLSLTIMLQEKGCDPLAVAAEYINPELGVETAEDALAGAMDIIAETISDNADYRKHIRTQTEQHALLKTVATTEEDSVYAMYYDFSEPVKSVAPHRVLAIDRGERENMLKVTLELDTQPITDYLNAQLIVNPQSPCAAVLADAAADAYKRLIAPSIEREVRSALTEQAGEQSIKLFSKNLHNLLMQPPIKGKTVLGLDPGYRTGCKAAVVDETGKVRATGVIYCTLDHHDKAKSKKIILDLIAKYQIDLIAIGNGTASKETELFVADLLPEAGREVYYMMVSEAGASVYSASKLAAEEFPDFTVEQRSAASIARRMQDPLSELVKIDPKAIGVGQYQHDMNQKRLGEALSGVVENCVNSVGVDLNTASAPLLSYVAGLNAQVSKNIVAYREETGKFTSRKQLLKVPKLGPKAFTQCAGFLRIPGATDILDNTPVHPESYAAAQALLTALGYSMNEVACGKLTDMPERLKELDLDAFCKENGVGRPTITDIAEALQKPGRDIRDELPAPVLRTDVMSIEDLKPGMTLTGTVRNVIDFGAFVDIGVHQDGLVHISQISKRFIKHPTDVLAVGDIVSVKVLEVDTKKGRIALTMKDV